VAGGVEHGGPTDAAEGWLLEQVGDVLVLSYEKCRISVRELCHGGPSAGEMRRMLQVLEAEHPERMPVSVCGLGRRCSGSGRTGPGLRAEDATAIERERRYQVEQEDRRVELRVIDDQRMHGSGRGARQQQPCQPEHERNHRGHRRARKCVQQLIVGCRWLAAHS
jgi:hypothetical protein